MAPEPVPSPTPYRIAMFPLEHPILPGGQLPLRIFEPRYVRLAEELNESAEPEFGTVGITRGREVGGADVRADIGVVARVVQMHANAAGQWAVATTATRRIRVVEWLDDDPYPQAMVVDWPDRIDQATSDAATRLLTAIDRLIGSVRARRSDLDIAAPAGDPDDPSEAIWRLIDFAGLGPLDRLQLLALAGATERAQAATNLVDERREVLDALGDD